MSKESGSGRSKGGVGLDDMSGGGGHLANGIDESVLINVFRESLQSKVANSPRSQNKIANSGS